MDSSLIKAMFTSRWTFSIIFAASATAIDDTLYVPAGIILWYSSSTKLADALLDPDVILVIVLKHIFDISLMYFWYVWCIAGILVCLFKFV